MAPGRIEEEEIYDYIVCGYDTNVPTPSQTHTNHQPHRGGTSGSVVAGRLAEDLNVTILVVEAGPDNADLENTHMAGGYCLP